MPVKVVGTPFTADDKGRAITFSGMSNPNNDGEFEILNVVAPNEVAILNSVGVAGLESGSWSFKVDFAVPVEAGDNNKFSGIHDGSGNNGRWRFIMDDDFFLIITYNVTNPAWFSIPLYVAEYAPKTAGQDTIANPAHLMMCADEGSRVNPAGTGLSTFFRMATLSGVNQLVGCLDENAEYQEWPWTFPYLFSTSSGFFVPESQPNEWDASLGIDLLELVVSGNSDLSGNGSAPDKRIIGSLKHLWMCWGLGLAGFVDSKNYLTLGGNVLCVCVPWDGVSSI
jgi:hypothetical protein